MSVSLKINHLKWTSHQQHLWYIYPGFTVVDFCGKLNVYKQIYHTRYPMDAMGWFNHLFQCWIFSMHPYLSGETSNILLIFTQKPGVKSSNLTGTAYFSDGLVGSTTNAT